MGVGPGAVATPPAAADVIWAWLKVSALLKGFGREGTIGATDMLLSRLKIKKFCLFTKLVYAKLTIMSIKNAHVCNLCNQPKY